MKQENVHEGHRKRMTEKVVKTPTSLNDHESEDCLEAVKSIVDIDALYEKFKTAIEIKQYEWYI